MTPASDIAFTPTVKALQTERGSRASYAQMEERGGFRIAITDDLAAFLATVDTAYLATTNAAGQPLCPTSRCPKGFIRWSARLRSPLPIIPATSSISTGNLAENDKAFLFLMDYAHRRRIKIWGRARVVTDDAALIEQLMPQGYSAKPEQAILFEVEAWDMNCPQHIPQKIDVADVTAAVRQLEARIATLETENAALRAELEKD
jgi:hypothetical protein